MTICTIARECVLGAIDADGTFVATSSGIAVEQAWQSLPRRFPTVSLDAFVVMPNHVHGIIVLASVEAGRAPFVPPMDPVRAVSDLNEVTSTVDSVPVGAGLAPPVPPMDPVGTLMARWMTSADMDSDEVITGTGGASPAPTAPESNVVVPSPEPSAISAAAPASDVAVPSSGPFSVPAAAPASLGDVVRAFKSLSARAVGRPLWQRSFYDHVVRDEADLRRIRQYIVDNPIQWALDPENPVSSTP